MSFAFEWPTFSDAFYDDAREMLAQALNKGEKPPIIADRIEVKELHMGTIPPELEILEIGDLTTERFRGIFRLTYAGDAYIVLQTRVQANPLNVPRPALDILGGPRILFAAAPLVVPMTLRLSSLQLRAIVVLVVSKQKGITLVFKNDPLEAVNVSSSFDGVESVAGYIQREIEAQLREAFRSDLPSVIHRLSQKWLSGEVKSATGQPDAAFDKGAKIETRTAPPGQTDENETYQPRGRGFTTNIGSMSVAESVSLGSDPGTSFTKSFASSPPRRHKPANSSRRPRASQPLTFEALQSVPEAIESYDPTYGLRPDALPAHANFEQYKNVCRTHGAKGLGEVLDELDDFEPGDYSTASDDDLIGQMDPYHDDEQVRRWRAGSSRRSIDLAPAYETIPAVGGGIATRPRVFHTQSQLRMRQPSSMSLASLISNETCRGDDAMSSTGSIHSVGLGRSSSAFDLMAAHRRRGSTSSSLNRIVSRPMSVPVALSRAGTTFGRNPNLASSSSRLSTRSYGRSDLIHSTRASADPSPPSSVPSPRAPSPEEDKLETVLQARRPDAIDLLSRSPSSILNDSFNDDLPIVLNASKNDSVAKLASLTSSNQTLSPFTREHEHVTARSSPQVMARPMTNGRLATLSMSRVKGANENAPPQRATRKRVYRIGAAKATSSPSPSSATSPDGSLDHRRNHGATERRRSNSDRSSSVPLALGQTRRPSPSSLSLSGLNNVGQRVVSSGLSEISEYFPTFRP